MIDVDSKEESGRPLLQRYLSSTWHSNPCQRQSSRQEKQTTQQPQMQGSPTTKEQKTAHSGFPHHCNHMTGQSVRSARTTKATPINSLCQNPIVCFAPPAGKKVKQRQRTSSTKPGCTPTLCVISMLPCPSCLTMIDVVDCTATSYACLLTSAHMITKSMTACHFHGHVSGSH